MGFTGLGPPPLPGHGGMMPPPPPGAPPIFPGGPPPPPAHPRSILGKIYPGMDSKTLMQRNWNNPRTSAPYNWRDKLRVPSRRKSESDLEVLHENDSSASWLSNHLSPNESRRKLVALWKYHGLQNEEEDNSSSHNRVNDPRRDLGTKLGQTAEEYLGLNLYEDTPHAMFIGHLLDTIEGLRAERNWMESVLTKPPPIRPPPPLVCRSMPRPD